MSEKETVLLTEKEKEQYLECIYRLQTAQSPGEAKIYKQELEGLIQKGRARAQIRNSKDISKKKVASKLLAMNILTVPEIAEIVELSELEVKNIQGNSREFSL